MIKDFLVEDLIAKETQRQRNTLSLIASENIASKNILTAVGSVFTNKYAEGYPKARYYGGCDVVDELEELAISRAQKLFGAQFANVQPHSGSSANMAAFRSLIKSGDTILAMSLDHGGHLTHGSKVNFSGQAYKIVSYGVDKDTQVLNYDDIKNKAYEHKPKLIIAGASAYARTIDFEQFRKIADEVGAFLLIDMAHIAGLVAANLHPSPIQHAHIVTSTTHKTLRGPRGGLILAQKDLGKDINKNIFPGIQGGPLMHEIAGKAVCFFEALQDSFKEYQKQVINNAKTLASTLQNLGFTLVSGGTDNHLVLINLENLNITGQEAESSLQEIGIIVNKNKIPFDKLPPTITSGIRIGTPLITTRGAQVDHMIKLANVIADCLIKKIKPNLLKPKVIEIINSLLVMP